MNKTEHMSIEDFRALHEGGSKPKYGNASKIEDGYRFDSKLEARRFLYWRNLWHAGAIAWFTRQVPFYLPGGIVYRADFLVVHLESDGLFFQPLTVEDCKGALTRVSINKIKQVEAIYRIKVHIIRKGDF